MKNIITTNKSFLTTKLYENETLLDNCVSYISNKLLTQPLIKVYGKDCIQHRNIGFFSDESIGYYYSNQLASSQPLGNYLSELLTDINNLYNSDFNGILVNEYMDGNDYISAHCDDEKYLSTTGVIAISYGAERIFRIKPKKTKEQIINKEKVEKVDIIMNHLQVLHMGGEFQKEFTHEIPKQTKIKNKRISFTFRKHIR
jgi:alkylated DNA repair dioxygenase AlkB